MYSPLRGFNSIIVFLGIAKIKLRYSIPQFEIKSAVHIKDVNQEYAILEDISTFNKGNNIEDEIEVLKSRNIISEVVEKNHFNVNYIVEGKVNNSNLYKSSPVEIIFNNENFNSNKDYEIEIINTTSFKANFNGTNQKYNFDDTIKTDIGILKIIKTTCG